MNRDTSADCWISEKKLMRADQKKSCSMHYKDSACPVLQPLGRKEKNIYKKNPNQMIFFSLPDCTNLVRGRKAEQTWEHMQLTGVIKLPYELHRIVS